MQLRPYQAQAVTDIRAAYAAGHRGVFYRALTGLGKTVTFASIARAAQDKGTRTLILTHRQELLGQTSGKLHTFDVDHGVLAANREELVERDVLSPVHYAEHPNAPVMLAMIQTLQRRGLDWTPSFVIIDEAHLCKADGVTDLLSQWPRARLLLVSATPFRLDGKGFTDLATALVQSPEHAEMVRAGHLVPVDTYTVPGVDLEGLRSRAGDFAQEAMAERFSKPEVVGDIVRHWERLAGNRSTLLFAASVAHSKALVADFIARGHTAAHLDGTTPLDERAKIIEALRSGAVRIVSNFGVLTEGFDCPSVACIQIARATQSLCLWMQMCGRGWRPSRGKADCLLLDHGRNVERHGLAETPRIWTLEGATRCREVDETEDVRVTLCKVCYGVFAGGLNVCPKCGSARVVRQRRAVDVQDGELVRVTKKMIEEREKYARLQAPPPERACPSWCPPKLWGKLEATRIEKGYKPGWTVVTAQRYVG